MAAVRSSRFPAATTALRRPAAIISVLGSGGPYASLSSYSSTFGSGFVVKQDIYLDTTWNNENGFDYAVAVNKPDGSHRRDFVWHVGVVDGSLLINASNNANTSFKPGKLLNENGGNYFTVNSSGWYTFETVFYDNEGILAVDMNLLDTAGNTLYSITRSSAVDDIATVVGGPRYGWLVYNTIEGLALDNTSVVPEPASLGLLGMGGLALLRRRRRMA